MGRGVCATPCTLATPSICGGTGSPVRLAGKNKSIGNRERFLNRHKEQIREAVRKAVAGRSIRDIEQAENVTIPKKDISEPVFHHGQGGVRDTVHPGNVDHLRGDRIRRPTGGAGGGKIPAGRGKAQGGSEPCSGEGQAGRGKARGDGDNGPRGSAGWEGGKAAGSCEGSAGRSKLGGEPHDF